MATAAAAWLRAQYEEHLALLEASERLRAAAAVVTRSYHLP